MTTMKRILCLIDSLGAGGAQRQMVGLATFLKERGYDVVVAIYHKNLFYADQLLSCGVPYVYLKNAERSATRIYYIAQYIRKYKPDVVIAYLFTPCICACLATLTNHSFKLIVSERNTTQTTGRNEKIRFQLFRRADYVVPNAYAQENYIKKNFPKLTERVVTIPNFVDLQHFTPPQTRERRELPEIIVVATIWQSKNTLGFIDAVAALKEKGYRFHISWYGKDEANIDYFNSCQKKIEELGVSDCLELKEKTNKISERYQDTDYFCLPSFYEGTPNVICEAMACGLPVVCSDVCDNSRYVSEGINGFLFNPKDADTIVNAFEKLFALNDEKYQQFCTNSRRIAEEKLSKESFVESYIKLIEG